MPRIRDGLYYYNSNNFSSDVPKFDINQKVFGCEAITDDFSLFDGIQFFKGGNQSISFDMEFKKFQITQYFYNISIIFQLNPQNYKLYSANDYYECCTTLRNNKTGNCTQVYISNIAPTTVISTTKADMNS